jgi:hypothetical protein
MGKRKITTMRLDEDLTKKAHDLGLNVSKICENALKKAIERMEGAKTETNGGRSFLGPASFAKEGGVVGRTGLIPKRVRVHITMSRLLAHALLWQL